MKVYFYVICNIIKKNNGQLSYFDCVALHRFNSDIYCIDDKLHARYAMAVTFSL